VSPALEKGLIEPDPDQTFSEAEMTSVTNWTVAALSTEMEVFVEGLGSYYEPLNVLGDDVIGGAPPIEAPLSVSDLSFSVSTSRNFTLGLTELTLDDVFGLSEFEATGLSDLIYGFSNAVFFGGGGDDVFFLRVNGSSQIFIGGSGADTYKINTVGMMIIYDAGVDEGTTLDKVVASGIGLSSNTSYLATIDSQNLYGYDELTQQYVSIIDGYEASGSKIELIELSDGVFTYQDIISCAPNSPNFLGDLSCKDALAYPTNMIKNEIDYYKTYAQMHQEILDTETVFHVDAYGILGKVVGRSGGASVRCQDSRSYCELGFGFS